MEASVTGLTNWVYCFQEIRSFEVVSAKLISQYVVMQTNLMLPFGKSTAESQVTRRYFRVMEVQRQLAPNWNLEI